MKELQLWIFATGQDLTRLEDWAGSLEDKHNDPIDRGYSSFDTGTSAWDSFMNKLFIYPPPAVAFMLRKGTSNDFELIRGMNGKITKDRLAEFYQLVLNDPTPSKGKEGSHGNGDQPVVVSLGNGSSGNGLFPGLNLGFGIDLPSFAWLLLAIGSGVQILGEGSRIKKGLFGAVAVISSVNYLNKKKKDNE